MSISVQVFPASSCEESGEVELESERVAKTKLARALACLGVKPSTFQALVGQKNYDEVELILKDAMIQITSDFQDR